MLSFLNFSVSGGTKSYLVLILIGFHCFKWSQASMNMFIFHFYFYSVDWLFLTFANFSVELLMLWYWFVKVVYTFWSLIIVACMSANVFSVNSLFSSFMVSYDSMDICLSKLQEFVMDREAMLRFMWSQRVGHDWATELNWTEDFLCFNIKT